jgi:ATPase subunit of ABC transporter with duplicated ATPase domains
MSHNPILINNIGLSFSHKTCFLDFSTQIQAGMRIAIIGKNGSGKSSLLKIIQGQLDPSEGSVKVPGNVVFGYLPQLITDFSDKSGAERFKQALINELAFNPNILLLDEPTNHLDSSNRQLLLRTLREYSGTLIIVSHDVELLRNSVDVLWHIDNEKVQIFKGSYDDYVFEVESKRASIERELSLLCSKTKESHQLLMKEQTRAKNSKKKGAKHIEQRKWPTVVSSAKACRAAETAGKKRKQINLRKQELIDGLSELRLPEIIKPKFSLLAEKNNKTVLAIVDGSVGYEKSIINDINLIINGNDRVAIVGDNGSGKSTLIKAILNLPNIRKSGEWISSSKDIGYLDQHYNNLDLNSTLIKEFSNLVPSWSHAQIRQHLNDFLFRKNEEVNALISTLSGGEKVRACLAKIALITPKLLILDEITNNLDLETRNHVIQVLKEYPGAMIVISHDKDFLTRVGFDIFCLIKDGRFERK